MSYNVEYRLDCKRIEKNMIKSEECLYRIMLDNQTIEYDDDKTEYSNKYGYYIRTIGYDLDKLSRIMTIVDDKKYNNNEKMKIIKSIINEKER